MCVFQVGQRTMQGITDPSREGTRLPADRSRLEPPAGNLLATLRIEERDRRLLVGFAVVGMAVLMTGGVFALIMKLVRTPVLSMFSPAVYYQALTGHGIFMFIFWLGFVQTAFLLTAGTVLIGRPLWSHRLGWAALAAMTAAVLLALVAVVQGTSITYNVPVPLSQQYRGTWLVFASYVIFALGMGLAVINFVATVMGGVRPVTSLEAWARFLRDIPIATFAAIAGLFIAVPGLLAAVATFGEGLAWSLGWSAIDPGTYRMNWHIVFHIYHYVPALTLVGVAYVLVDITVDARSIYAKQLAKALFLLYPLFVPPTFIYHLLVDPDLPQTVRTVGSVLSLLVGVPTILHAFIILSMLESRLRRAGHGAWTWPRHLPWRNPAFGSLAVGMFTLMVGGLMAYLLLQEPLAPMLHNTFFVPAYIHPIAAGGANIVFMGALFVGVPVLAGRRLWGLALAGAQPYFMGAGLLWMAWFGGQAGLAGVPRRYAALAADAPERWVSLLNLALGIGAMAAVVAGVVFLIVMLVTAVAGRRASSILECTAGMGPPDWPSASGRPATPLALVPPAAFLVLTIALTVWGFQRLAAMAVQIPK